MKVVVCAIARNEDKYIKDFCLYHFNLGFDEIHIYDNVTEIPIVDNRIIVHPFRDINCVSPQQIAYNEMIRQDKYEYDWCAFIDIDEFITLNNYNNIHDFINSQPNDIDSISMKEIVYGDSGKIIPDDITIPVYDRLTELSKKPIGKYLKHIVKRNPGIYMLNPHIVLHRDSSIVSKIAAPNDNCYIRHYKTKTLSEFCDQKLDTPRVFKQTECRKLSYYFNENEKTREKIQYLKERDIL